MTQSIAIVIPYFGEWPAWINFFIESCRANSSIDWIIFNDQEPPENSAPNLRHIRMSFAQYKALVSQSLGINFEADRPYKLCDIRPALAHIHRDLVSDYDFVGFGDIDVIYGDIRSFYDDDLLSSYDLLSSHRDRVSGHLCLMRNTEIISTSFRRDRSWKRIFESMDSLGFDEAGFYRILTGRRARIAKWLGGKEPRCLFHEAYSTPGPAKEMRWRWEKGQLTNEFYPLHPFMYLHFMSWHSSRWYPSLRRWVEPGTLAPWPQLSEIVQMDWREARKNGFMISPRGIQPIERRI